MTPIKPVFVPSYYQKFQCIASACRHSCCIGWEIDVDREALTRYDGVGGPLGERLRACIDREAEPPCFRLAEDERCPFLRGDGLCDLICELGEDSLCHICADHPRFRNILNDRVELGLGMSCEAAAALILRETEPFTIVPLPLEEAAKDRFAHDEILPPDPDTAELIAIREAILPILQDRARPLSDRVEHLLRVMDIDLYESPADTFRSFSSIAAFLRDMERLDPAWDACLDALETLPEDPLTELSGEASIAYENLLGYFLYRYMTADPDGRLDAARTRTAFAILATTVIHAVCRATGRTDFDSLCEVARAFSSEIEYSEENLETFMAEVEMAVI